MNITKSIWFCLGLLLLCGCRNLSQPDYDSPDPECDYCRATHSFGHFTPERPVYTGEWEFISLDGSITNGTWQHQFMMSWLHQSVDERDAVENTKQTGLLRMWWDRERTRPYILQEYVNGEADGYYCWWYPNRNIYRIGIVGNHGADVRSSTFSPGGTPEQITLRLDTSNHLIQRIAWPSEHSRALVDFPKGALLAIDTYTNSTP